MEGFDVAGLFALLAARAATTWTYLISHVYFQYQVHSLYVAHSRTYTYRLLANYILGQATPPTVHQPLLQLHCFGAGADLEKLGVLIVKRSTNCICASHITVVSEVAQLGGFGKLTLIFKERAFVSYLFQDLGILSV